jgi:2-phospho-L-lactate/phosphoenolpyruvate guanylyltransferase
MDDRPAADLSRTWALVPIRGIETAKTRLGEGLDPEERAELVTRLLERTLEATRRAAAIRSTLVVTRDPRAGVIAAAHAAVALLEHAPDLNAAIRAARSVALERGATAVLVLPADLPAVDAAALDHLLAVAAAGPAAAGQESHGGGVVALVSDRHGEGTNVLLLAPPDVIDPRFGADSRALHARAAREAGARYVEVDGPLSLDIDTPTDLLLAEATIGRLDG